MIIKFLNFLSIISFIMGVVAFIVGKAEESVTLLILSFVIDNAKNIEKIKKGEF